MAEQIIAFGLLTRSDLELLGASFNRAYPVDQTPCFGALLAAVDEADRDIWRLRDLRQTPADKFGARREERPPE